MKVLAFFCALLVAFSSAQLIFDDLPGANDAEKINLIRAAVSQVRAFAAGQACLTAQFPNPQDQAAIEHWSAWICSYLGGPTGTNEDCTFFDQFGDNETIVTTRPELILSLILKHDNKGISTQMSTLFTNLLARALIGTGATTLAIADVEDALANATAAVVDPDTATAGCPTAAVTIQWSNPANRINAVALNGLVTWVWADDLVHSIEIESGGAVLAGFGSGDLTLSRLTACNSGSPSFPDGGTPCNLGGGGAFSYSHVFEANATIGYHCNVHSTLTGTLTVGNGGGTTNTNTNTNPNDVDADGGDGGDGDASSTLKSWLAF
jgi:plastocyanin